jgi:hypothetical protein
MHSLNKLCCAGLVALGLLSCGQLPKEEGAVEELGQSAQALVNVPFMSQYQGQPCQNVDCGPADVAMIVKYYGLSSLSNYDLQVQVRFRGTGSNACGLTGFGHLETALASYGIAWSEISSALTPAPSAQLTAMKNATDQGKPVIALIHGADFGRQCPGFPSYGDHWVVVRGFSADNTTVYLNDPDTQQPKCTGNGWIVGGQISVPYSTFSNAASHAASGPYGIIASYNSPPPPSAWCSANCGGGGWWCAGDGACIVNGAAGHNYHCSGNNVAPDRDQACALGCHIAATGYPDYCNYGQFCGGGSWCGNDCVNGYPKTLYTFTSGGSLSSIKQCQVGYASQSCAIAPAGYPDYCY